MAVSEADLAAALDLFDDLGDLTTRAMMGGRLIYANGSLFALVHSDGRVMLKGTPTSIPQIEAAGGEKWVYTRSNGVSGAMPYWILPPDLLDDPARTCDLARQSLAELEG
ncbi:TfoX/Sxy family protein [Aestuariibius sp. 2305UL40-4]|uniref:TfoX/Sxy family protein n=1 Tax=Aestuariibius violaceus TaxID=3234132 RepID=UPI00345EFEA5